MAIEVADRKRSPNFPSFPLGEVLRRVFLLYEKDKGHPVDRDAAAKAMGYTGERNGAALRMLASLQQFGLLESVGKGTIKISQTGMKIVRPLGDDEKQLAISQAFRTPAIFETLLDLYGDDIDSLPSEITIQNRLIREMGFAESAAASCVSTFIESFRYIGDQVEGVKKSDDIANEENAVDKEQSHEKNTPPADSTGSKKNEFNLSGPLSAKATVNLSVTGPVGKRELERLKSWLTDVAPKWVEFAIEDHLAEETDD